jgi:hypothetical protein
MADRSNGVVGLFTLQSGISRPKPIITLKNSSGGRRFAAIDPGFRRELNWHGRWPGGLRRHARFAVPRGDRPSVDFSFPLLPSVK